MNNILTNYAPKITTLCETHKVKRLYAFGSVITDRFSNQSDIDLVVDFKEIDLIDYADNYFDLQDSLEDIFGRKVDLLEDKAIRNPILRKNIDDSKQLIYG
jgi:predicted nucleotidyltransferase